MVRAVRRGAFIGRRALALTLLLAAACADLPPASPTTLDDAVVWETEIRLEESEAVINVAPRVVWAADGTLLIADDRETQIRRYAEDGRLLAAFGRRGGGPGQPVPAPKG